MVFFWGGWRKPTFVANRFRLVVWWMFIHVWSIWGRVFAICLISLMDVLLFWLPFLNRLLQQNILKFTADKQDSDTNLSRSAKFKQHQTRSTKGTPSINLQTPHAETNQQTPSPKVEGAAVLRRMTFSITTQVIVFASGPKAPRACLRVEGSFTS